jgi:AraC-like DNA-binding protein
MILLASAPAFHNTRQERPSGKKMPVRIEQLTKTDARRLLSASRNGNLVAAMRVVLKNYRRGRWLTIRQAADLAGVSVRTLQRRLAAEGSAFSELVEQVRAELADETLKETVSLKEVAKELGYSTPSNFSRALRRWTGKRPSGFRRA